MSVSVSLGMPERLRPDAARLYWQAFGGKLGFVMGPEPRALAFLTQVIRTDHVIIALDQDGRLVGLAGFKSPKGSFAAGDAAHMRQSYGMFGGFWRSRLLGLLSSEVDNENFLLDGICVAPSARGHGIGSALLEAVCVEAQGRGYASVRLDVIDANWRAQQLYRRLGFVETRRQGIGLLRLAFGFDYSITMVRRL